MPVADLIDGKTFISLVPATPEQFASGTTFVDAPNIVKDMAVFKAGTLRDSTGKSKTWTVEELHDMVKNFYTLRDRGLFPNVPVRANHEPRDVRLIGGYYKDVRVKGDVLFADIEFTEPEMAEKYNRKTYRSRSIEIGAYRSNDDTIYYPTILGLAFCDIPAVEGLYSAAKMEYANNDINEVRVFSPETADASAGEKPVVVPELEQIVGLLRQTAERFSTKPEAGIAVQKIILAVQALTDATAAPSDPAATHSSGDVMPDTFKFEYNGVEHTLSGDDATQKFVSDLLQHNTTLTDTNTELTTRNAELATENATLKEGAEAAKFAAREAAVDAWFTAKKIAPPQVDAEKALVKTMGDDQYTAYCAIKDAAPVLAFTQEHAGGDDPDGKNDQAQKVTQMTQTYNMLKQAGVTGKKLAESKAYRYLASVNALPEE